MSMQSLESSGDGARKVYVGNLDASVTEFHLTELFSRAGEISQVKVMRERDTGVSCGYGFIEFSSHASASAVLLGRPVTPSPDDSVEDSTAVGSISNDGAAAGPTNASVVNASGSSGSLRTNLGSWVLKGREVKLGWAYHNNGSESRIVDEGGTTLFVGDLSPEVDDALLAKAFGTFGTCSESRVMWDPMTQKSRGYGFVSYVLREDAEKALREMNGQVIGSRGVRVNWAVQKGAKNNMNGNSPRTVYVGNLAPEVTEAMLKTDFQAIGGVSQIRLHQDKGYAFVTFFSSNDAARAIESLNGKMVGSKAIKCAWGRERERDRSPYAMAHAGYMTHPYPFAIAPPNGRYPPYSPHAHPSHHVAPMHGGMPGMGYAPHHHPAMYSPHMYGQISPAQYYAPPPLAMPPLSPLQHPGDGHVTSPSAGPAVHGAQQAMHSLGGPAIGPAATASGNGITGEAGATVTVGVIGGPANVSGSGHATVNGLGSGMYHTGPGRHGHAQAHHAMAAGRAYGRPGVDAGHEFANGYAFKQISAPLS